MIEVGEIIPQLPVMFPADLLIQIMPEEQTLLRGVVIGVVHPHGAVVIATLGEVAVAGTTAEADQWDQAIPDSIVVAHVVLSVEVAQVEEVVPAAVVVHAEDTKKSKIILV